MNNQIRKGSRKKLLKTLQYGANGEGAFPSWEKRYNLINLFLFGGTQESLREIHIRTNSRWETKDHFLTGERGGLAMNGGSSWLQFEA